MYFLGGQAKYEEMLDEEDEERKEMLDGELRDEYEYYDDWLERDDELNDMSLDEYDYKKRVQDYGLTDEEMDSGDLD